MQWAAQDIGEIKIKRSLSTFPLELGTNRARKKKQAGVWKVNFCRTLDPLHSRLGKNSFQMNILLKANCLITWFYQLGVSFSQALICKLLFFCWETYSSSKVKQLFCTYVQTSVNYRHKISTDGRLFLWPASIQHAIRFWRVLCITWRTHENYKIPDVCQNYKFLSAGETTWVQELIPPDGKALAQFNMQLLVSSINLQSAGYCWLYTNEQLGNVNDILTHVIVHSGNNLTNRYQMSTISYTRDRPQCQWFDKSLSHVNDIRTHVIVHTTNRYHMSTISLHTWSSTVPMIWQIAIRFDVMRIWSALGSLLLKVA